MHEMEQVWNFCHARLDEAASALLSYKDGHVSPCVNYEGQDPADYDEYDSCARHLKAARATPYRDAEFGLAEVAFKRLLLEGHEPSLQAAVDGDEVTPMMICREDGDSCELARRIAVLFHAHPDYQEGWRP